MLGTSKKIIHCPQNCNTDDKKVKSMWRKPAPSILYSTKPLKSYLNLGSSMFDTDARTRFKVQLFYCKNIALILQQNSNQNISKHYHLQSKLKNYYVVLQNKVKIFFSN